MSHDQFDRFSLKIRPLAERKNKVQIERDHVAPDAQPRPLSEAADAVVAETAERIREAREADRPRMMAFGAHAIKNGLAPVLVELIEKGWITHLATNGAGIIHDWEIAFQGETSEDVQGGVERGEFGIWEETGFFINLAILVGAYEGLGYGQSIGKLVEDEGLKIPCEDELMQVVEATVSVGTDTFSAASDLLGMSRTIYLEPGWMSVPHPFKQYGLQAAAWRLGVPFTGHPMVGHDIIYCHPMNNVAAIGRTAQRDFLSFAQGVSNIDGGVYLSVGSAVMSPMIFEKSMAMAQNLAIQEGRHIDNHFIAVVDLQPSRWDWRQGEPPMDNPDYYLRYCKTFARMGGTMRYASADNRDFLLALLRRLKR